MLTKHTQIRERAHLAKAWNSSMKTKRYLMATERLLGHKRKLSISFDLAGLGKETALTALIEPMLPSSVWAAHYCVNSCKRLGSQ